MPDNVQDIADFLAKIGLNHLAEIFQAEDVDMEVLKALEPSELAELGLTLGQRKKITLALKALDAPVETPAPADPITTSQQPIQLRRLSVLFCDIVGSTSLGEQYSIDEMQYVLQHYYDIAQVIADEHQGHILGFQGDGVVMLFGFPRGFEGIAERCVQGAMAFQKALAAQPIHLPGRSPLLIETRIGIATGKAAVGHADGSDPRDPMQLVGPVVNRAARLQTVAKPNAIVVDLKTHELTQSGFSYSHPELHRLKGLPEDQQAFHVLGVGGISNEGLHAVRLIGRDDALAQLDVAWDHVCRGNSAQVTITGDAGIGKSALVRNFLAPLEKTGTRIAMLHAAALAEQNALRPIADYLDKSVSHIEHRDDYSKMMAISEFLREPDITRVKEAARFLGIGGSSSGKSANTIGDKSSVFDLLTRWIKNPPEGPTVVVMENAHWVDVTSRELGHLYGKIAAETSAKILLIALSRDDKEDMWGPSENESRIALAPLSNTAAEDLLNLVTGGRAIAQTIRDNVLSHSSGNPLMIETLGRPLAQPGTTSLASEVEVPHTIYESVSKRLDGISAGRRTIEALAVLNSAVDTATLAQILDRPEDDSRRAIAALQEAGFVIRDTSTRPAQVQIRHQVYRDVIYEQIAGQARQVLHAATYTALRTADPDLANTRPDILAMHAYAARDHVNAADHALNAGEKLLRRSALIEAGHYFDMASDALTRRPDDREANELRLRMTVGKASVERSRFGIATDASAALGQEAARLARTLGDSATELLALNGLYAHALVRADYPVAQSYAAELLDTAERSQNETFTMIATRAKGVVAMHRAEYDTAATALRAALAQYDKEKHLPLAHAHGYDHAEICAAFLSITLWLQGDLVGARDMSDISIAHARDIDHAHSLSQAMAFRVMLGALARDADGLLNITDEAIALGSKFDIRVMREAAVFFPFASRLFRQDRVPTSEAMTDLRARVADFRAVNPYNYGPLTVSIKADIEMKADIPQEAAADLDFGRTTAEKTGEIWTSPELTRLAAKRLAHIGDSAGAEKTWAEAFKAASAVGAQTLCLRISCDIAENAPTPDALRRVETCLARMVSDDGAWDMSRAKAICAVHQDV